MTRRHTKAPPRPTQQREDEGLVFARLCIRVMERFFATTNARPKMEPLYLDLLDAYMDVLQQELAPYAFDLAYELFSENDAVAKSRREQAPDS